MIEITFIGHLQLKEWGATGLLVIQFILRLILLLNSTNINLSSSSSDYFPSCWMVILTDELTAERLKHNQVRF